MPNVLKAGDLNLLESSGPVKACNWVAFELLLHVRYILHTRLGSEFILDFTIETFDMDRIQVAQDKVSLHESGNTQTVPFIVSFRTLTSSHGKPASAATNRQRLPA
jgi:hypothetical protein